MAANPYPVAYKKAARPYGGNLPERPGFQGRPAPRRPKGDPRRFPKLAPLVEKQPDPKPSKSKFAGIGHAPKLIGPAELLKASQDYQDVLAAGSGKAQFGASSSWTCTGARGPTNGPFFAGSANFCANAQFAGTAPSSNTTNVFSTFEYLNGTTKMYDVTGGFTRPVGSPAPYIRQITYAPVRDQAWLPMVDPMSLPVGTPQPYPVAVPYRLIPHLPQSPLELPYYGPDRGNQPRQYPNTRPNKNPANNPRPYPKARPAPRPAPRPVVTPGAEINFEVHPGQPYPTMIVTPKPAPRPSAASPARPRPGAARPSPPKAGPHRFQPAPKNVHEKKFIATPGGSSALGKALNAVTEGADLVDAIHKALPKEAQAKRVNGKRPTPQAKAKALWDNQDLIDWDKAWFEILNEQGKDKFYGKLGKKVSKAGAKLMPKRPVGPQTGPAL